MSSLPLEITDAFTAAAATTLKEMVNLDGCFENETHETGLALNGPVVIATIHLLRDPPGSISLVLTSDTAVCLALRYLPVGTELADELISDVAGEFVNVLAGQAKTMLKGTPYHFSLSIPEVVRAEDFRDLVSRQKMIGRLSTEVGEMLLLADLTVRATP